MKQNCRDYVRRLHTQDHNPADPYELSASDQLFAMLDGQWIRGREGVWRAEVVSIVAAPDATWVQIAPAQRPGEAVLLRMTEQRAQCAIEALRAWMDLPADERPSLIDVGVAESALS